MNISLKLKRENGLKLQRLSELIELAKIHNDKGNLDAICEELSFIAIHCKEIQGDIVESRLDGQVT